MHRIAITISIAAITLVLVSIGARDPSVMARARQSTPEVACPVATEQKHEATARRWFEEAINGANLAVIDEIVAADIVHHSGTLPDSQGSDGIKRVLEVLLTGFPDARHTIEQVIANENFVVVRWRAEGTQEGEFQGFAPTGEPVTWTGINIFRMDCGKIVESWSEVDGLGRLTRLGLVATPTP